MVEFGGNLPTVTIVLTPLTLRTLRTPRSCPTNLGTAMRASLHIPLPSLTADGTDAKAKAIAKPLGLSVRGLGGEHTPIGADGTVDISPSARFCIKEAEVITALYKGIELLKKGEDEAAASLLDP
jgi:protein-arginine kinase